MWLLAIALAVVLALVLAYHGRAWAAWTAPTGILLGAWVLDGGGLGAAACLLLWVAISLVTGVPELRQRAISRPAMRFLAPRLPKLGDTERTALEAGTVWWDRELCSGAPDWERMARFAPKPLSEAEQRFLDGPCAELCRMLDDHAIRAAGDLPPAVWDFMKRERFFGMIIPEEHGGLGFSAIAHSTVIARLASRSAAACVTVMVPNSLGPAELLLHYGTDRQKQHYLPRLATGEELPCFALTEPHAGSDAAGLRSRGIVCEGMWEGRRVLGMRLSWDKRYITLAPVATVLGLAFRLQDPDHLLGDTVELGITCALIPARTRGVWIGHRHDPLGVPFQNGPTRGTDVFLPIDFIIGGRAMAGQGWRMLMESLSAGRALSLPAYAAGGSQLAARAIGAYAGVREQFGLAIGRFGGVEAALGRIAGTAHWVNAVRVVTAGAVDAGERPSVVSAIAKWQATEAMRRISTDAMDVAGGAGICKGPRNVLAALYESAPIGITVEGANILTRSLIVFGQGALRCHPYALAELEAARAQDLPAFDAAFSGHAGFIMRNAARAFVLGLTGGALASAPVRGRAGKVARKLSRLSAAFALVADTAMATLGGELKRAEAISGRLADAMAWLYIGAALVNRRAAEEHAGDEALFAWASDEALWQVQTALRGVLDNLPSRPAAWLVGLLAFPLGARHRPPSDRATAAAARALLDDGAARTRLTRDVYVPSPAEPGLGRLEHARELAAAVASTRAKLRDAQRTKRLAAAGEPGLLDEAIAKGVITTAERVLLRAADDAREEAIRVDDRPPPTPLPRVQPRAEEHRLVR